MKNQERSRVKPRRQTLQSPKLPLGDHGQENLAFLFPIPHLPVKQSNASVKLAINGIPKQSGMLGDQGRAKHASSQDEHPTNHARVKCDKDETKQTRLDGWDGRSASAPAKAFRNADLAHDVGA